MRHNIRIVLNYVKHENPWLYARRMRARFDGARLTAAADYGRVSA